MEDRRERAGGGVVLLVIVVLALLVGGGWAAAYYRAGDTLAHGTTVDGVDVGGRSPAQAVEVLRVAMEGRLARPIRVSTAERSVQVRPRDAGLGIDYGATVDQAATTTTWRPASLWQHYSGGQGLDPVLTVDGPAMAAEVARLQRKLGTTARDGAVAFSNGHAEVTRPRTGHQLDPAETANALEAAFIDESGEALLTRHDVDPRIDDRDLQRAMDRIVNPALSGSVRLLFRDIPARLQPQDFTAALSVRPHDGRLVTRVDRVWLARLLGGLATYTRKPVDATVALVDGLPQVVRPQRGVAFSQRAAARAFLLAVGRDLRHRTQRVHGHPVRPDVTAKEARRWRIREVVARSSEPVRGSGHQLAPAVEVLDQTVLAPGGGLDLGRRLGDLGSSRGVDRLSRALATAAGHAGLAVAGEGSDLQLHNSTPYGVLVHLTLHGSGKHPMVRVQLWSRGSAGGPAA